MMLLCIAIVTVVLNKNETPYLLEDISERSEVLHMPLYHDFELDTAALRNVRDAAYYHNYKPPCRHKEHIILDISPLRNILLLIIYLLEIVIFLFLNLCNLQNFNLKFFVF